MGDGHPRVLAGRYELGPIIGRGGMAEVYRARDRTLERDVAVKLVLDGASKERFLVEARRTAQIRHPAIVEVFDVGIDQEAFLVMALLEGESLQARLERERSLSAPETVTIAAQICEALGAAHAVGVVHRDIKPGNVFLPQTTVGTETQAKVLDFGVAKRIDGKTVETEPGVLIGTLAYMAPEQIRGEDVDGRSDLYSLGVVLYRCLCGRLPFERSNMASLIHAHLRVEPPHLTDLASRPELARLDSVVMSLLAKLPADRPQDAAAARAALLGAASASELPQHAIPALCVPVVMSSPPAALPEPATVAPVPVEPSQEPVSFEVDHRPAPVAGAPFQAFSGPPARAPIERVLPQPPGPVGFLASIPTSVSKRVAAYAALTLVLHVVFFHVNTTVVAVLSVIFMAGLIAYLGATRA